MKIRQKLVFMREILQGRFCGTPWSGSGRTTAVPGTPTASTIAGRTEKILISAQLITFLPTCLMYNSLTDIYLRKEIAM